MWLLLNAPAADADAFARGERFSASRRCARGRALMKATGVCVSACTMTEQWGKKNELHFQRSQIKRKIIK